MKLKHLIDRLIDLEFEHGREIDVLHIDTVKEFYAAPGCSVPKEERDDFIRENQQLMLMYAEGSEYRNVISKSETPFALPAWCWGSEENINNWFDTQHQLAKENLEAIEESVLVLQLGDRLDF